MAAKKKQSDKKLVGELRTSAHKIWLAGLGAVSMAEEEGSKMFQSLVNRGETMESRGKKRASTLKKRAGNAWDSFEEEFEARVARALRGLGVPTREELDRIARRLDRLEKKGKRTRSAPGPASRKRARKAPARKKSRSKKT